MGSCDCWVVVVVSGTASMLDWLLVSVRVLFFVLFGSGRCGGSGGGFCSFPFPYPSPGFWFLPQVCGYFIQSVFELCTCG